MMLENKDKNHMRNNKENNMYNTELMLPISEIRSDTILLKDGGLRAIVKIEGLNIDLKNTQEQEVVVEQYKKFLNGLSFPLQILVRNTYLELSDYINYVNEHVQERENKALRQQGESYIQFLSDINVQQGLIYVKEFYIIIPYYPLEEDTNNMRKAWWRKFLDALSLTETPEKIVQRYRSFIKNQKFLETRVQVIISALQGMGLSAQRLGLRDIIALLFESYNPELHKYQSSYNDNKILG